MDIKLQQVSYAYAQGTPFEKRALFDVDFGIPSHTYQAIIGHTGSGKSTILQHFNALLRPTSGEVHIGDRLIVAGKKAKDLKAVRQKVGIVFQFPEHQLFEETVLKDIMFGPMNFGISEEEAEARARELVNLVGLPDNVLDKSPFDLSGGQMRRVAIAGVLAMDPEVIVLDEPTAGLDPRGQKEIMDMFYQLHQERHLTTILVTHSMEDAARYADNIVIMHEGKNVLSGSPRVIFKDIATLKNFRLEPPRIVRFQQKIEHMMGHSFSKVCLTEEELAVEIAQALREERAES
ncbi:energy-coupling factor ABC transporter ATP-binding protein [Lysinibacillus sp. OL1_EC]|uniref:energy-coupling factor ABC transporter ATP-binding protein n=1 Tax=unclassified Lysinibacillus TaxID=2636778 RepID=UPI00103E2083|nr:MULTISPECIES: energy-coupling factor ABC transporter ATP-binding protein [unclassified Lysinibacillus]MCM0625782.1 energy-coupling factor ABC transporter ATP-binding protein [Lysinibacillus sp. OL1_EC]TBV86342.1 energy-coupling factor ABC transporter ATP-binding protein [Lysinibacillus sp. OL1]UKJ45305.1 energy-coupling factor ABC transporter ATP-binding protein [Lysinibacillus sp. ACHW1.5]WGT37617.1 energy-coupling factor ABC transporter ATP-binding protein [Lysinibacillus sp. 1 U-2021]